MNLYLKDSQKPEQAEDVGQALIQMIEQNSNIIRWKFHLAFTKFDQTSNIKIIYDSEWCRIKFMFSRQRSPEWDELLIQYGRVHAPNEESFMRWAGQECRCWHNIMDPLRFLDGLSPSEAIEQVKTRKQLPEAVRAFKESDHGKKLLSEYPPKSVIVMHSKLWERYGHRLFKLFDLRQPQLWTQYQQFIKEYHQLMGTKTSYGPPLENIC